MHRASPSNTSFRAFSGGGTRSAVDIIDDLKLMQEHAGNFMAGESRKGIEAPQNYGFTSVVMPAIKDALGKITDSAEAMVSFMGGNRSFPVAGVMDDRRHRLFGLQPGDVGMFRTALDKLQFHFSKDGGFLTGPRDKTVRMQLLDEDSGQQQQQQGGAGAGGHSVSPMDASGGSCWFVRQLLVERPAAEGPEAALPKRPAIISLPRCDQRRDAIERNECSFVLAGWQLLSRRKL